MYNVTIVTSNYNSRSYLPIAKLSLYSAFNAIKTINREKNFRIVLVDSASTDGSFEELTKLGNYLSSEIGVHFESIKLKKDLGNSFAYAYGFLYSRTKGTKYIVYMDNDFIITEPNVLEDIVNIAERMEKMNRRYYAIVPMIILESRDMVEKLLGKYSFNQALGALIRIAKANCRKIVETNLIHVDIIGRTARISNIDLCRFEKIVNRHKFYSARYIFLSPMASSTFSLHPAYVAPLIPYLYIYGDDQTTSIQHAMRGYFSIVIPEIIGVHCVEAVAKRSSPVKAYFAHRNIVLGNISTGSRRYLFHTVKILYDFFVWTPISLLGLKKNT